MATSIIPTIKPPMLWRNVQREITQSPGGNYWSTQVTMPQKAGYTRTAIGVSSDNANVIIVGMYMNWETNIMQWRTHNLSNTTQTATLSCLLVYLEDNKKWT